MKWLLYILLLANLATFFWHYQPGLFRTELSQQPQVDAEGASIPQLVLLREYQAKQQTGRNSTVAVESCFNLGPFAQRKAALQVMDIVDDVKNLTYRQTAGFILAPSGQFLPHFIDQHDLSV